MSTCSLKSRLTLARLIILVLILVFLAACGDGAPAKKPADAPGEAAQQELTLDELSAYNGKDDATACIAIDAVIYDVSNAPRWRDGEHNGFLAGQDLTDEIKTMSPHGASKLQGLPVVGKLVP